jgi:SAM-dependent methyltransferase
VSYGAFACGAATASFRDPAGRLFSIDDRVLRLVNRSGVADMRGALQSATIQRFIAQRHVVGTQPIPLAEARVLLQRNSVNCSAYGTDFEMAVEHERVSFPSFPFEWTPEMLWEAGKLTLDLLEGLLDDHFGLKDATPYNILFRGPEPLFVDVLSFERRDPRDATWLAYAQFVRTFVLPLLVNKHFGVPLSRIFLANRDGLEPEEVYRLCGALRRFTPPFLTVVSIPKWLGASRGLAGAGLYETKLLASAEQATFILRSLFGHVRRMLARVAPRAGKGSVWSEYMPNLSHYTEEQFAAKQSFVDRVVGEQCPRRVLDVGCNTGLFSIVAARKGAEVVAIDSDPVVIGNLWRTARRERLDILPLVVDFTRPSPGVGWRNGECQAFLQRAGGAFDAVLMLAVIHHMLVTERVPLPDIVDLVAELTTDCAVAEFIAPDDPMFRRLTRGRDALFTNLTAESFERAWQRRFTIMGSDDMRCTTRRLYVLRKVRGAASA